MSPSSRALVRQLPVLILFEYLLELDVLRPGLGDDVRGVVDHLLEIPQLHPEQIAHLRGKRLEEPDMRHRHRELDVAHSLAPNLRKRDLDPALVTYVTAVPDPLELPAVALPVLDRSEDALAKEAIAFRLEGPVVDRLRLGDLSVTPGADLLGGGELDLNPVELGRPGTAISRKIDHLSPSCFVPDPTGLPVTSVHRPPTGR